MKKSLGKGLDALFGEEIEDKIADILIERAELELSEISLTAVKGEIKVSYKA